MKFEVFIVKCLWIVAPCNDTAGALVQCLDSPCAICSGQNNIGIGIFLSTPSFTLSVSLHHCSILVYQGHYIILAINTVVKWDTKSPCMGLPIETASQPRRFIVPSPLWSQDLLPLKTKALRSFKMSVFISQQGVISQTTWIFSNTTAKTANLTTIYITCSYALNLLKQPYSPSFSLSL